MTSQFQTRQRSHMIGELSHVKPGTVVKVCGWFTGEHKSGTRSVSDQRPSSERSNAESSTHAEQETVLTLAISDRTGRCQIQLTRLPKEQLDLLASLAPGSVLSVTGRVIRETVEGQSSLHVDNLKILSRASRLPFNPWSGAAPELDARFRWKYLDLRRDEVQRLLTLRSKTSFRIRQALHERGFLELETPLLERFSPQNASAFIVPWTGGESFALPQTPQLYKQLLMIGGCDRYFQFARSFRREVGLSPYRQLEFTALDIEMSFISEEDLFTLVESALSSFWELASGTPFPGDVPRLSWDEAQLKYGTDTPDLRFGLPLQDITDLVMKSEHPIGILLRNADSKPGPSVRVLHIPAQIASTLPDVRLDSMHMMNPHPKDVKIGWMRLRTATPVELEGPFSPVMTAETLHNLQERLKPEAGDVFVTFHGIDRHIVTATAAEARAFLGHELGLIDQAKHSLVWVQRYPYWEYDADSQGFRPARHPFTQPDEESRETIERLPGLPRLPAWGGEGDIPTIGVPQDKMSLRYGDGEREAYLAYRSRGFELVLNGIEVGTGSIRCHTLALQEKIFAMFGYQRELVDERFGTILEALRSGAPPHGGISVGLDRVLAELTGLRDIREFSAFPKDSRGTCPMTKSPSPIDPGIVRTMLKIDD